MVDEEQILWNVVEEHLDEAEFLVEQWASARRSPLYTLTELDEGPQARLDGHVDGLVVNGPLAHERVVWPAVEGADEPARVTAAALALLDAGDFRVLQVLDEPRAQAEPTDDDEPVDEEALRLATLRALAERLDALEPDAEQRTAVAKHELGAEAWRRSAVLELGERVAHEDDEARAMELGEIRVLLEAHAPDSGTTADADADADDSLPPEWSELGPEEREQRRQAELKDVQDQLAATTDPHEREGLQELQQTLLASAPEPDDADSDAAVAEDALEPEPEPEPDPRIEGLALALALSSHPQLGDQLRSRLAKAEGASLALLLQACADRGLHPGPAVERGLVHDDPQVQAAALRAAAYGERSKLLAAVESRLQHRSPSVRAAALDTAMQWGSRAAWELALLGYKAPDAAAVRLWIACLGDDRHVEAMVPLLDAEPLRHDVLWALGFSGRVPAVEACLPWLDADDELTRRLAGEAIAAIVGLDLEDETLWEQAQPEPAPGDEDEPPLEEDLDDDLAERPEGDLPLPIAAAIRERWAQLRSAFEAGRRYLLGKPVEREGPGWALPLLSCRRVDVVAREVVARTQGVGRWPGRAPSARHQQAASALAELGRQAGVIQGDRR